MKNRSGRRSFLKQIGVTGTAAALFPGGVLNAEIEQGSVENKNANEHTETQLMLQFWQRQAPDALKKLPFTLIDTPGKKNKEGCFSRPTTKDTVLKWLSFSPRPGKCLFISSQPFIGYQHSVISTYLPKNFCAETVGSYREKDLPLSVYLDNLSRWLYQEQLRKQ